MGFLDNTGDIILDIVLTDEGRKRLSAGNGSFKITKFALTSKLQKSNLYTMTYQFFTVNPFLNISIINIK